MDEGTTRPGASAAPGAWYGLGVLMLAFMFAMVSRVIIALLVQPIQRDLGISDTQFGLLNGFAFVVFYLLMGIPIAWLADRMSRRLIVVVSVALWSLMTAACGMAHSFTQLFAARMALGVGEAGLTPAVFSLLPDMFPRSKLGRVFGIYNAGALLGFGASFLIGSTVIKFAETHGDFALPLIGNTKDWQAVFLLVGLLGAPLVLLLLGLREPSRSMHHARQSSLIELRRFFRLRGGLILLIFAPFTCLSGLIYGTLAWLPAIFGRLYHLDKVTIGLLLGVGIGTASPLGALVGGTVSDFLSARGRRDAPILVGLLASCAVVLLMALSANAAGWRTAAMLFCLLFFCLTMIVPVGMTTLQAVTPAPFRAQIAALYTIVTGIGGMTLGTLVIGVLTDHVFMDKGSIGSAVAIFGSLVSLTMAALFIVLRGRYLRPDESRLCTSHDA